MERCRRRGRRMSAAPGTNPARSACGSRHAGPRREAGITLVELMLVVAMIGIITAAAVPQFIRAYDRSLQRGTLADMRSVAGANATYHLDIGTYCTALAELEPDYLGAVPFKDDWDNDFGYSGGATYTLQSFGSDGAPGPDAPAGWGGDPYEVDLIVQDGEFTQAPEAIE